MCLDIEIAPAVVENFTDELLDFNNIFLNWDVHQEGTRPQSFQIKRDGEVIAELPAKVRTYRDTNMEIGTYTYRIVSLYGNNVSYISDSLTIIIENYAVPINFRYYLEGNDVLLFWNIAMNEEMPISFQIRRNGNVLWESQNDLVYNYTDTSLAACTYTYCLYALYENGMVVTSNKTLSVVVVRTSSIIKVVEGVEWEVNLLNTGTYHFNSVNFDCVAAVNNMNLSWFIAEAAIQPTSFKIERNGDVIATLNGDQRSYIDSNLEVGTYVYTIQFFYTVSVKPLLIKRSICTIENCD
jgi:hypothetical protein